MSTLYLNFTDLSFFSAFKRERDTILNIGTFAKEYFLIQNYPRISHSFSPGGFSFQVGAEIHVVEKDQDPEEEETEVLKCLPAENKKTETRNRSQVKIKELFKTLSSKWYI